MSFQDTERIFALNPSDVPSIFASLHAQYAEEMMDGNRTVMTIGAYWDDLAMDNKRAASIDEGTIVPISLIDGRVAYVALWQSDLADFFDSEGIEGVEELTWEQLKNLSPQPDPIE